MYDEIRVFDYYFFGIGTVSLVSAFFLFNAQFEFYYIFILFFFATFFISLLLNMKLLEKLSDIFFLDTKKYILNHLIIGLVISIMTGILFVFIENIFLLMSYFMSINFFVMAVALFMLMRKEVKF